MKFSCEKAVLLSGVTAAARSVSTRSSIPALEGILIDARQESVTLSGYNLATGIRAEIGANVESQGAAVLNARLFSDIVRKLPDDYITVSADDKLMVSITCGLSEFKILGLPAEDFPALPEPEEDLSLSMKQTVLKSMIDMTIFAVSDNENKPIHTGALFDVKQGFLTVVAVDGYRMAVRKEPVVSSEETFSFVVPAAALREVERLCGDGEDDVKISLGKRHIAFDMENVLLISRLLEGEFLNYDAALPKTVEHSVTVDTKDLQTAVERVSLIISERLKNPVRCVFDKEKLHIWCQTALGKADDEIPVGGDCEEIEIGFNNRYLHDAVRAVPDEKICIEITNSLSPCVIKPLEGDSYLFMILPVRLKA